MGFFVPCSAAGSDHTRPLENHITTAVYFWWLCTISIIKLQSVLSARRACVYLSGFMLQYMGGVEVCSHKVLPAITAHVEPSHSSAHKEKHTHTHKT